MEKTSLALRLVRISLEIGSQIDSKCHKNWLAKATRIGLENHENGNAKGSYNIVVFLTICISYANNCFTL